MRGPLHKGRGPISLSASLFSRVDLAQPCQRLDDSHRLSVSLAELILRTRASE
jgi:hypothetical protein